MDAGTGLEPLVLATCDLVLPSQGARLSASCLAGRCLRPSRCQVAKATDDDGAALGPLGEPTAVPGTGAPQAHTASGRRREGYAEARLRVYPPLAPVTQAVGTPRAARYGG